MIYCFLRSVGLVTRILFLKDGIFMLLRLVVWGLCDRGWEFIVFCFRCGWVRGVWSRYEGFFI